MEKGNKINIQLLVPDYCVRADNKLRSRVPLMVGDVVVCLQPDPLLTFRQETVVAWLPFTILHYWTKGGAETAKDVTNNTQRKAFTKDFC